MTWARILFPIVLLAWTNATPAADNINLADINNVFFYYGQLYGVRERISECAREHPSLSPLAAQATKVVDPKTSRFVRSLQTRIVNNGVNLRDVHQIFDAKFSSSESLRRANGFLTFENCKNYLSAVPNVYKNLDGN